jgi:hypothetical protein
MLLALVSVDLHHNSNHQMVIIALQRVKHIDTGEREVQKVYMFNKGEGQLVEFIGDDNDIGMEMVSDGEHKTFESTLSIRMEAKLS